ncbi:hypothetical protein B296_00053292 [Ensete ventricosum]|uniref:Uncharacterized protein n=1 Tax=Ensete ventricosum TaxID=4639 RepID=A0A426XXD3_ENSVE|nr:hypothetical protein B296_00053292 [Ensete ventricosum]
MSTGRRGPTAKAVARKMAVLAVRCRGWPLRTTVLSSAREVEEEAGRQRTSDAVLAWPRRRLTLIRLGRTGAVPASCSSFTSSGKVQLPKEVERPLVCCCLLVEEAAIEEALLGQRAADEAGKSEKCAVIGQQRRDGRIVVSALLLWLEGKCRGWAQMRVSTEVDLRRCISQSCSADDYENELPASGFMLGFTCCYRGRKEGVFMTEYLEISGSIVIGYGPWLARMQHEIACGNGVGYGEEHPLLAYGFKDLRRVHLLHHLTPGVRQHKLITMKTIGLAEASYLDAAVTVRICRSCLP